MISGASSAIEVGEVIEVVGTKIIVRAYASSNLETHFFGGEKYKGVSIREMICIQHGFRHVVGIVEGEYLDERNLDGSGPGARPVRKLHIRPIGYFEEDKFFDGIKFLPKIADVAFLLEEKKVAMVYDRQPDHKFVIGHLLKEDLPISLPWQQIFAGHVGIFGNTGSGKSNTLAKLFTTLFSSRLDGMVGRSSFVLLDFNGEYSKDQLLSGQQKYVLKLTTREVDGDRYCLSDGNFWDAESLGVLFQATANTQKPFLRRVVRGRARYRHKPDSLYRYFSSTVMRVLTSTNTNPDALEQLRFLAKFIDDSGALSDALARVIYNRSRATFVLDGEYLNTLDAQSSVNQKVISNVGRESIEGLTGFEELQVRAGLQLVRDVLAGAAQYEHIQPLLRRIEALKSSLSKVVSIGAEMPFDRVLNVISLRDVNVETKKIISLLIAKQFYERHRDAAESPPLRTAHLIVDEAHNILSNQSVREAESWKDYRLELFEEIIKEGRKFGMFVTLASQRPSDISPTIVSQLHNFFIHRLVNDRDLALLDNTISTLDSVSRSQIPSLPRGACVVTGTAFDVPMLLQIDRLGEGREPDSRDVDLEKIWSSG